MLTLDDSGDKVFLLSGQEAHTYLPSKLARQTEPTAVAKAEHIGSKALQAGQHKLVIAGREDGASIDKICITVNPEAPSGMGGNTTAVKTLNATSQATSTDLYSLSGMRLSAQNAQGPCIAVSRTGDGAVISRKVVIRN